MGTHSITANQLPEIKANLAVWLRTPGRYGGPEAWALAHPPEVARQERNFARHWSTSLEAAEPTYVSSRLTRTALAAGDAFDDYRLTPEDVPHPHGLVVWEEHITHPVKMEVVPGTGICAATWAVMGNRVQIRWWTTKEEWLNDWMGKAPAGVSPKQFAAERLETSRWFPQPLVATGASTLPFASRATWPDPKPEVGPANSLADIGEHFTAVRQMMEAEKTLAATWLLMNQALTVETQVHAPRAAAQRIGRLDPNLLTACRYVTLRQKHIAPDTVGKVDGPKREWAHRWLVSGHWRNQPYPSMGTDADGNTYTQRIWITDHFKGPDGAPILDPDKLVKVLRR